MILNVLDRHQQPMTMNEIMSHVSLSRRTIRGALQRLVNIGVVQRMPCLEDMRMQLYAIVRDVELPKRQMSEWIAPA